MGEPLEELSGGGAGLGTRARATIPGCELSNGSRWRSNDMTDVLTEVGAIDCDVHPTVPDNKALLPYLEEFWRDSTAERLFGSMSMPIRAHVSWMMFVSRSNSGEQVGGESAIAATGHMQRLAADEAGALRSEERDGVGDIARNAHTLDRL